MPISKDHRLTMTAAEFTFFNPLRVRWAEVDLQKVVFNGHYLLYFDVSFTEYWRATGLPDAIAQNAAGQELFVRTATVEYHAAARFDDMLQVGARCARLGRSSMTMTLGIFREQSLLVSGELVYVFVDTVSGKSLPLPEAWRERLVALEVTAPEQASGGKA
jgi:acyl-CoA thioester hydrolase